MIAGLCRELDRDLLKDLRRWASRVKEFIRLNMPDCGFLQQVDFDFELFERSLQERGMDTSPEAMRPYVFIYNHRVNYDSVRESQCLKRYSEPYRRIRRWGF